MNEPAKKRATYADLLAVPEHLVAEIIDGVLYTMPRPAKPHGIAATVLGEELGPPFRRGRGGPGGWIFVDEPELHLGSDILVPDLAGWRRERMPQVVHDKPYFELAPDWLCKVLSPSTAIRDKTSKLAIYGRERVRHVWWLDPIGRTLEVLRYTPEDWRVVLTAGGDQKVRAEPFDAIELDLSVLWADVVLPDLGP